MKIVEAGDLGRSPGLVLHGTEDEVRAWAGHLGADPFEFVRAAERARCVAAARGCTDYLGGYTRPDDRPLLEAFHHGIQTVVNVLSAPPGDRQAAVVERIGFEAGLEQLRKLVADVPISIVPMPDETWEHVEQWATWSYELGGFERYDTREAAEKALLESFHDVLQRDGEDVEGEGLILAVVGHVEPITIPFDKVTDEDERARMEREGWSYLVDGYRVVDGSGTVRRQSLSTPRPLPTAPGFWWRNEDGYRHKRGVVEVYAAGPDLLWRGLGCSGCPVENDGVWIEPVAAPRDDVPREAYRWSIGGGPEGWTASRPYAGAEVHLSSSDATPDALVASIVDFERRIR